MRSIVTRNDMGSRPIDYPYRYKENEMGNRYSLANTHPSFYRTEIGAQFKERSWFEATLRDERRELVENKQFEFWGDVYLLTWDEFGFFIRYDTLYEED